MKPNLYVDYCTGCGLCHSVYGTKLEEDSSGFLVPLVNGENMKKLAGVCPAGGMATLEMEKNKIWGRYEKAFLGWAADADIRKSASSGGVLTALCCFLLESKKVDGIIQIKAGSTYHTQIVISRTANEVKKCMGSRYSASAPLMEIKQLVRGGEKYAFVGKPCDVSALRMYLKEDILLSEQIVYLLSFFCAGTPGKAAQKKLLEALGCKTEEECVDLQYRGNGWPGFATATKADGSSSKISYNDSWGKILGRDVRKICRYCIDGIGEMADISCGDAWYLTDSLQPDFSEKEGRNVVFSRTGKGADLLGEALAAGYLVLEDYRACEEELKYIQKYQYERRATMGAMISGLKICRKGAPKYSTRLLKSYSGNISFKVRAKRFLGTIKRAIKGRI